MTRWALAVLLAGCTTAPGVPVSQSLPTGHAMDLLFVIDNSNGTSDWQTVFASDFPSLVTALDALPGGRPDLHIGVVSTSVDIGASGFSMGNTGCLHPDPMDDGRLQGTRGLAAAAGCPVPTDRYISDVAQPDGTRLVNYPSGHADDLASTFGCIAQLGSTGCAFEAPLEAMKRALDGSHPENAGFLRPGASLTVVVLTDEDDASIADPSVLALPASEIGSVDFGLRPLFAYTCATPILATEPGTYTSCRTRTGSYLQDPTSYDRFLTGLVGPNNARVLLIAGDPVTTITTVGLTSGGLLMEPACHAAVNGNNATANTGIRLADFLAPLGDAGAFATICQSDYSSVLPEIAALAARPTDVCLDAEVAANVGTCTVDEVTPAGTTRLANCATPDRALDQPCWSIVMDPACPTPSQRALFVERTGEVAAGTSDLVTCAP